MYKINIREEIFGGTLFDLIKGKRYYINKSELNNIMENCVFPNDISISSDISLDEIKFTKYTFKSKIEYYSFADIIFLELTRKCNLRCKHCLNNSGVPLSNELQLDEFKKIIKHLADHGTQDIRFTGGEPLMFEGIFELIKLASDNGLYTSIGTNGTLITKKVAKKLKEAGLRKAVVSIDGTRTTHDFIRGYGNFDKAIEGLNNLKEVGIDVRVNSVLMKSNVKEVISLAKELDNKNIHIFLRRFIETGRGENLKDNMLSKKDYDYVKEQLKEELKKKNIIGHYLLDASGIKPRIELPFKLEGCKAGQRALAIMADGDVHLCGFLYSQGVNAIANIRDIKDYNKFWNALQKHDILKYLREKLEDYNSIPGIQETYCLAYVQRLINKGEL